MWFCHVHVMAEDEGRSEWHNKLVRSIDRDVVLAKSDGTAGSAAAAAATAAGRRKIWEICRG